jgi:putative ABC transport system ATP-binding protein
VTLAPVDGATLRATGLSVRYADVLALDDVGLTVGPGQFVAVTGPSGAGKSTLLWTLAGAHAPTTGTVEVDGTRVSDRATATGLGIALVPQGNGLAMSLTARENVLVALLALGVRPADARERTSAALTLVGLEESGGHLIEELSGGQQQRVAIARGLATRSRVLLADEPTSDLDAGNRGRMVAALRAEAVRGAVVVMSTHDPEAAAEADGEIALDQGRMTWRRMPGRHRA